MWGKMRDFMIFREKFTFSVFDRKMQDKSEAF